MKLFLAGDYWSNTGPANVTQNLIQGSNPQILYQKTRNKALRTIEILYKTIRSHAVVYSGFSLQNLLGFKLAKWLHRPSFYLMHGSIHYESLINKQNVPDMIRQEADMLEMADFILAVSKPFEAWLKKEYPQYANKIYTLTNGISWDMIPLSSTLDSKISGRILSVGGGVPIKNILTICKAINIIYQNTPDCAIQLIVLGAPGKDSNAINAFPFVKNYGLVSHEETLTYMNSAQLFIQNSSFETFGLAPIEALLQGCSLLISSHAGAISIFTDVHEEDIIFDPKDISELTKKILFILTNPNSTRLLAGINPHTTSVEYRQTELLSLVRELGSIKI